MNSGSCSQMSSSWKWPIQTTSYRKPLPRTQTSLFWWKCARKGRREGDNGRDALRLPFVPFPWSLVVHHQSLVSRSPLPCEKRSAWGGGCTYSGPLIQNALCVPLLLQWGLFLRGGDGSFQVVWQTDVEVDLEQMQNYCLETLALFLCRMII